MNEQEKEEYLEKYKQAKEEGVPFYPDILFKDAVIALVVFLGLVALAYFVGAPLEARADPADTSYTPRPEWYFLFLFQLLKYFPGQLEVIGVILIPGIVLGLLFFLPLLDRDPDRHYLRRPWVSGITTGLVLGIVVLTGLSISEAPPPSEEKKGDTVAALYSENCATCHGPSLAVPEGTDLHEVIAQGTHEGMPAWSGDLSTNEIDALAGFITSPAGNELFKEYCQECHQISNLVANNPINLKNALEQGQDFAPHEEVDIPVWREVFSREERTELLNFLAAPDGQRLFSINCSSCHGSSVSFSGEEEELREIIREGGLHLEMPPWRGKLSSQELDRLAHYVTAPSQHPQTRELFKQNCSSCHGSQVPEADNVEKAREIISTGGAHETMPVWGKALTDEQLTALVDYTLESSRGTPLEVGQELYAENCASCHGTFGEGGPNPTRPGDIIPPISSAEYLKTRDNVTLENIIAQGQPNLGMSPFGSEYGGPLSDEQIDAIVTYMRSWESDPPVEFPPEISLPPVVNLSGQEVYNTVCTQCHAPDDPSSIGSALGDPEFQASYTDQEIFETIKDGHPSAPMISFGNILSDEQIQEIVAVIRSLEPADVPQTPTPSGPPSFAKDVLPIFEAECNMCHGSSGGWDGTSYETVINSGDHGPAVVPGNIEESLLAQKMLGTHEEGAVMPPSGMLPEGQIQLILDWIAAGAPDN